MMIFLILSWCTIEMLTIPIGWMGVGRSPWESIVPPYTNQGPFNWLNQIGIKILFITDSICTNRKQKVHFSHMNTFAPF